MLRNRGKKKNKKYQKTRSSNSSTTPVERFVMAGSRESLKVGFGPTMKKERVFLFKKRKLNEEEEENIEDENKKKMMMMMKQNVEV